MRVIALCALACAAAVASPTGQAAPPRGGGGYITSGHGHAGGGWGGAPYRPGYGRGHGYGGWHYGYPGYGFGLGLGLGYGAGWAWSAGSPWYWGAPAAVYGFPGFYYPYGYAAPLYGVNADLSYVQQPPAEIVQPPPARQATSYWYYCTEPAGYYPYVRQCSRPWVPVQPQFTPPVGSAPAQ